MKETIGVKSLYQNTSASIVQQNLSGNIQQNEANQFAMMLLESYLSVSRNDVLLNNRVVLEAPIKVLLKNAIQRIAAEEPIQYILGQADFYGDLFQVSPSVLIPRRETEELVYQIAQDHRQEVGKKILDIGTGSGCIAIMLYKKLHQATVEAWDISQEALAVATQNNDSNKTKVAFRQVDVFSNEAERISSQTTFDIVVSNPPYVCQSEMAQMHRNVLDHEPDTALFVSDDNPLIFYSRIAALCSEHHLLKRGGMLYLEINEQFGKEVASILQEKDFHAIEVIQDMQKKDRFVRAMLSI